jgi:hypothetical protein
MFALDDVLRYVSTKPFLNVLFWYIFLEVELTSIDIDPSLPSMRACRATLPVDHGRG